jgi:alcohol dehydrogenase
MRALQLVQPGEFRYIDVAEPAPPGPGQALIRVHRVGICGTDYGGYLGKMPFYSYPRIPGHELGVEVVAVGSGVTHVQPGDRCSVEPYINCQACSSCRRGFTNCCENHQTLGVHCDGGLQRHFLVPARKLHPAPDLTYDQAALVETLAIGCHAVHRSALKSGETALVIGAGPIGLSVIEFTRLTGARTVVMDTNAQRLAFVRDNLGVEETILSTGDGSEGNQLETLTKGERAHVVVDATGSNQSMSHALNYCAFAGRLVYVGITQKELSFPHALMHRRELSILASRNALSADFPRIISLIGSGQINTRPWLTHQADFEELATVFPTWMNPATGVIKAVAHLH